MPGIWTTALCGSDEDLCAALAIAEEDGPARGLNPNRVKSLLYIPDNASFGQNPLPSDIPINRVGFDLLGCPSGPPPFCEETMFKRVRMYNRQWPEAVLINASLF